MDAVGFTAYASADRDYLAYQHVLFDSVIINEGLGYQTNSSFYICPVDGLYVFGTSLCSSYSDFSVDIMRETQRLLTSRAHAGHVDQGMVSVVTECAQAERVWVRLNARDGTVMSSEAERSSTFSGFLINY